MAVSPGSLAWAAGSLSLLRAHVSPILGDPEFDGHIAAALAVIERRQRVEHQCDAPIELAVPTLCPYCTEQGLPSVGGLFKDKRGVCQSCGTILCSLPPTSTVSEHSAPATSGLDATDPSRSTASTVRWKSSDPSVRAIAGFNVSARERAAQDHREHRLAEMRWNALGAVIKIRDADGPVEHCASISLDDPDIKEEIGFLPTRTDATRARVAAVAPFAWKAANGSAAGSSCTELPDTAGDMSVKLPTRSPRKASNTVLPKLPGAEIAEDTVNGERKLSTAESRIADRRELAEKLERFRTAQATELENKGGVMGILENLLDVIRFPDKHVIDPDDGYLKYWNILMMFLVIYTSVMVPYNLGFGGTPGRNLLPHHTQLALSAFIEVCYLLDICLTFVTGFHVAIGDKIMKLPEIRRNYVRGWFVIDMLSSLLPCSRYQRRGAGTHI
jgi:YD repeat-containing protein